MDTLLDPSALREREDVEFQTERTVRDEDGFEYFSSVAGLAAVGITNEEGEVLLMNSPHGWRLPYGPVDTNEDWATAARRIGAELTGVTVDVAGVERVAEIENRLEGDNDRETLTYDVIVRIVPVTGEPISSDPGFGPWDELELGWFDAVPDDAYWEHEDAVDDVRTFVE